MAGVAYFAARDLKTSGAALSATGKQYVLQLNQQTLQLELGSKTIRVNQRPDTLNAPPLLFDGKLYVPVRLIEKLGCTITDIGSNYFGGECKNHLIVASDDVLVW